MIKFNLVYFFRCFVGANLGGCQCTSQAAGKALQIRLLRIDGLVEECLVMTPADLKSLPQEDLIGDFTCREGWSVPNLRPLTHKDEKYFVDTLCR
jgi:DMSO/TMAO reductase YedYZ molybdopterin-dependent catalytic subunit